MILRWFNWLRSKIEAKTMYGASEHILGHVPWDMSIFKNSTLGPVPWGRFKPIWAHIDPKLWVRFTGPTHLGNLQIFHQTVFKLTRFWTYSILGNKYLDIHYLNLQVHIPAYKYFDIIVFQHTLLKSYYFSFFVFATSKLPLIFIFQQSFLYQQIALTVLSLLV